MGDTTTDQRVCVVCDEPIQLMDGSRSYYQHIWAPESPHDAQPKLAHPMDDDPFAGADI